MSTLNDQRKPTRTFSHGAVNLGQLPLSILLLLLGACVFDSEKSAAQASLVLEDFSAKERTLEWVVVNDNVMGGRSLGEIRSARNRFVFAGSTNTNGGGFSSIRAQFPKLDLAANTGIELHLKGDGRQYIGRLNTNARWRGRTVSYWSSFDTEAGEWQRIRIPFSDFVPTFRGRRLSGLELDPGDINGMGLMIYDGNDGPFILELKRIIAY